MQTQGTSSQIEKFRLRFRELDARLASWQQQVRSEIEKEFARLQQANEMADQVKQQNAARLAMARAGDGPRHELNEAIDELCALYLETNNLEREALRQMVQEFPHIFHDLWGYVRRAAEQVRSGGGEHWLRYGLAVVSLEDLMGDWVDTVEGMAELCAAAARQKIEIQKALRETAAMSNDQVHEGREVSARTFLQNFDPASYAAVLDE